MATIVDGAGVGVAGAWVGVGETDVGIVGVGVWKGVSSVTGVSRSRPGSGVVVGKSGAGTTGVDRGSSGRDGVSLGCPSILPVVGDVVDSMGVGHKLVTRLTGEGG